MKPRPTPVTVIAIFHFILGGLGVLVGLFEVGTVVMEYSADAGAGSPRPGTGSLLSTADINAYLDAHIPYRKEVEIVQAVLTLALSVLMIAAGFMCLQLKPSGRTMSLIYAVASIPFQIAVFFYYLLVRVPAMNGFFDLILAPRPGAATPNMAATMKSTLYVGPFVGLIGLVFPVLVLIFMLQPRIAAAFRGEWNRPDDYAYGPGGPGRVDDRGGYPAGYDQPPPGYGGEPDDRYGPAR